MDGDSDRTGQAEAAGFDAGFGHFPICIAKTQYSFTTDANAKGAPEDHVLGVREIRLSAGAEFVVAICGDVMTMQMVDKVEIPAGGSASFAPKGAHVMLMGLKAPLKKGTSFPAILHFEKAGDVTVEVTVQGIADLQPMD